MQQAFILDEQNRAETLDPTQSFIVQAPAGSGKTGLLIQRLLVLLAQANRSPEECLAITFTRKAAFEMRDRILLALQHAKDPNPPTDHYEKKLWELARAVLIRDDQCGWDLLENPGRLQIQTIDAFCAGITRQMPILSRFGALPQIIEDGSEFYRIAARNLLKALESEAPWSDAVRSLLMHLDNNLVIAERLLSDMLTHRDQWLPYIGRTFSRTDVRALLEAGLQSIIQDTLALLIQSIPAGFEDIIKLAKEAAVQLKFLSNSKKSLIVHCQALQNTWPGGAVSDLVLWQGLAELLLTEEHTWRKAFTEHQGFPSLHRATQPSEKAYFKAMKDMMCELVKKLEDYPRFREHLAKVRECPKGTYEEEQWIMVNTLVQLLPILVAELSLVFQEQGKVDFTEITLAALKALGDTEGPTELALGLDYKIHHILMDEFQDTSLAQFRLIEQLVAGWEPNDGRTLFLVGDPMQSIYRFRQAEVGLFIRARQQGIGGIPLRSLQLMANFRSDPTVVKWTNAFFEQKFPKEDDIASSAISFHAAYAKQIENRNAVAELHAVTLETEKEVVVGLIHALQKEDPNSSIAILVRSRSHLQKILPRLRDAGIHYQGIELELLTDQPIVQDLWVLTRALLHLGDKIAWLALLRGPLAQLSLEDLFIIANVHPELPVWHALQTYSQLVNLSEPGKVRLAKIVPILSNALSSAYRLPLRKWITDTWIALSGDQFLYTADSSRNAEAFLTILEEDYNFYEVGILEQRIKTLYANHDAFQPNAVQIMTIHKAKGLEFDNVIVVGIGRKSMADPTQLLLWEERVSPLNGSYFILAPMTAIGAKKDPIYVFLRQQEKRRAEYEAVRIEYVAATRARKKIYWLTHKY